MARSGKNGEDDGTGSGKPRGRAGKPGSANTPKKRGKAEAGRSRTPAAAGGTKSTRNKKVSAKGGRTGKAPSPVAKQPWLKSYPKEIPAEIGPFSHDSLADMMLESCRLYADRPAFTCMGTSLTFSGLEKASRDFAAYLQSIGLEKGARVAIMMPNVLQYPVVGMAALRAGYVVVNVNPLYTRRELEHQLADSGAEAIIIMENFAGTLQAALGGSSLRHVIVATMGDMMGLKGHAINFAVRYVKRLVPPWSLPHISFKQAMREGAAARFAPPEVGLDDTAFLQYTGGTTGIAKGAVLLHRNVLANVMQNSLWLQTAYLDREPPERPVHLCALPLYHIYALTVIALMGVRLGAESVLVPNPRDIPGLVKVLRRHAIDVFPGLNTLFNALLNNEDFRRLRLDRLKLTLAGGMAVQRSVAERWKEAMGHTICEGYGLSETSPVVAANRFDIEDFTGTIGLPLPSTEVAIRDDAGRDLKTGEVGEICIRGPQVMAGYWNRPDETARCMTEDGFLRSGDMGTMDAGGHIRLVDRKKDMIVVSGFNVYPNEIEEIVSKHPGVLEVAAIGVPDEHSGEVPKLFIVKREHSLTEEAILEFCRGELTGYKRPKYVEFRSELPKSNVGKIMRRQLR